jgi:hypothetical protein
MKQNISILMRDWKESDRYKVDDPFLHIQIENIINNLEDFLQWIKNN